MTAFVVDEHRHFTGKTHDDIVPYPEVGAERVDEDDRARSAGRFDVAMVQRNAADADEWHGFDPPKPHCTSCLVR